MSLPTHIKSSGTPTIGWGTSSDVQYGIVQSEATTPEGMWKEIKNHIGQIIVKLLYDTGSRKRIMILLDSTKTPPAIGDTVTWDSVKYVCEGAPVTASNEDWTQLELELAAYQGITLA